MSLVAHALALALPMGPNDLVLSKQSGVKLLDAIDVFALCEDVLGNSEIYGRFADIASTSSPALRPVLDAYYDRKRAEIIRDTPDRQRRIQAVDRATCAAGMVLAGDQFFESLTADATAQ